MAEDAGRRPDTPWKVRPRKGPFHACGGRGPLRLFPGGFHATVRRRDPGEDRGQRFRTHDEGGGGGHRHGEGEGEGGHAASGPFHEGRTRLLGEGGLGYGEHLRPVPSGHPGREPRGRHGEAGNRGVRSCAYCVHALSRERPRGRHTSFCGEGRCRGDPRRSRSDPHVHNARRNPQAEFAGDALGEDEGPFPVRSRSRFQVGGDIVPLRR